MQMHLSVYRYTRLSTVTNFCTWASVGSGTHLYPKGLALIVCLVVYLGSVSYDLFVKLMNK